jgi:hypothetical protein
MKFQKLSLPFVAAVLLVSGCETPYSLVRNPDVSGSNSDAPNGNDPGGMPARPAAPPPPGPGSPTVVCDPFNSGTTQTARNGIKAQLTYVDNYQSSSNHLLGVSDYEPGMRDILVAPADIFLSKLDVPLHAWDSGFMMSNGEQLKKSDGEALFEGFSLRMSSTLVAPSTAAEGDYQFAWISDDGSTLQIDSGNGYQMFVNNDGVHPQSTACSDRTIHLSKSQPLPFKAAYFQGPRYHIALQLMWRKVPAASAGLTCSGSGWAIVPPEAYQLPGSSTNPCAN